MAVGGLLRTTDANNTTPLPTNDGMSDKLSTKQKAVATAVIWVVYLALLIFGKQMFGPATASWSWGLLIVALIPTLLIWRRSGIL
jgi:hypothetical protein